MQADPKIKAFKRPYSILVKYYDDGSDAEQIACPACSWSGESSQARSPSTQGHSLLRCPECGTVLGTIVNQRVAFN